MHDVNVAHFCISYKVDHMVNPGEKGSFLAMSKRVKGLLHTKRVYDHQMLRIVTYITRNQNSPELWEITQFSCFSGSFFSSYRCMTQAKEKTQSLSLRTSTEKVVISSVIVSFVTVYDCITTMSHFDDNLCAAIIINVFIKKRKNTKIVPEPRELRAVCVQCAWPAKEKGKLKTNELSVHKDENKNAIFDIFFSFSVAFKWLYDLCYMFLFPLLVFLFIHFRFSLSGCWFFAHLQIIRLHNCSD